jgi:hypothetical protein
MGLRTLAIMQKDLGMGYFVLRSCGGSGYFLC